MKVILTYGTFDLFHVGHVRLLERLRDLGDHLIVGVSTDSFNAKKGKRATMTYADRAEIVGALRCVDRVIPEHDWPQKIDDIKNFNVSIFGMGDDWVGKFDDLRDYCEVVYLPRTEGISTTSLRATIYNRNVAA
jgi:glycerol-3-phosphate cytidylyltransferase